MALRGVFFIGFFAFALIACLTNPFWGVLAYFAHYFLWPEKQWWGELLSAAGIRMSLTIAGVLILSTGLHWPTLKARIAGSLIHRHEGFLWAYAAIVGLSSLWAGTVSARYLDSETPPFEKMYKLTIFAFVLTHIVTSTVDLRRLVQFLAVTGGAYLGWVALEVPLSQFVDGRLEGIGGPDFQDANFLGIHFVVMGIMIGVSFFSERGWWLRLGYLGGGALVCNALILTRSRGAFLALLSVIVCAVPLAPRELRKRLVLTAPFLVIPAFFLTDAHFWDRISTISADKSERDRSSQSRLDVWLASIAMVGDHPLGVGAGNFSLEIGKYAADLQGRDAHSTIFRTLGETGVPGLLLILALLGNSLRMTQRVKRKASEHEETRQLAHIAWGIQLAVIALFVGGLTVTMTYVEEFFLFLSLPVCCERALANELQSLNGSLAGKAGVYVPSRVSHGG